MNQNLAIFAYLLIEEDYKRNYLRLERRLLRDTENPFHLPEKNFIKNYRLTKNLALTLIQSLIPHHENINVGTTLKIDFHLEVLSTLYFLSNGSYQTQIGNCNWNSMSQSSISRAINKVVRLIATHLMNEWIRFPTTNEQKNSVKEGFFIKSRLRGVIGAIDGTHVNIIAPPATDVEHAPHLYINRKGKHSINVMLISDADCQILAVDARFPGSVHDAAIWQMSNIRRFLIEEYERGDTSSHLIGDSGYGIEPWLFTPYAHVEEGTREARFNSMLTSARNVIERTNGILKARFRCLLQHRVLHYHPATAAYIIYACTVLHNMALNINYGNEDPIADAVNNEPEDPQPAEIIRNAGNEGRRIRDLYVQNM